MKDNIEIGKNNSFFDCLLEVTKELKKRTSIRGVFFKLVSIFNCFHVWFYLFCLEFQKEFENEISNFPLKQCTNEKTAQQTEEKTQNSNDADLKMEVYEDQDYDIEEIKFWNFMSKNKGMKPSIIRTAVYKVPETQYVVKKCEVTVSSSSNKEKIEIKKLPTPTVEDKTTGVANNTSSVAPKVMNDVEEEIKEKKSENITVKSETPVEKPKIITNNNPDDIILIDESDDIIEFNDNIELDKDKTNQNQVKSSGNEEIQDDVDDKKDKKLGILPKSHNIKKAKEAKTAKSKLSMSAIEESNRPSRITRSRTSTSSKN